MNTGRIRDQWHTMSRTGNSAKLLRHTDEPFIDIHPVDANAFNLVEGDIAVLKNRGARFIGRVKIHDGQRRGEVFVPMHWNYRFASSSRADALVNAITDPLCGQPEFKHSPVSIFPYFPSWHGIIYSTEEFQVQADYSVKIPLETGFKYRIADKATPNNWDMWLKRQFPEINDWVEMRDSEQELYRLSGFKEGALTVSFAMQTKKRPSESRWLETQLGKQCDVNTRFNILAGSTEEKQVNEGAIVCSCFQVGENTIINEIKKGCKTTQDLTNKLQCGGNCGSCLPELNSLISQYSLGKNIGHL